MKKIGHFFAYLDTPVGYMKMRKHPIRGSIKLVKVFVLKVIKRIVLAVANKAIKKVQKF